MAASAMTENERRRISRSSALALNNVCRSTSDIGGNVPRCLTDRDIYFTFRDIAGVAEMTDLIRSACLMHYAETARSVGLEPTKMLRKVRLPLACLNDQNLRVAV